MKERKEGERKQKKRRNRREGEKTARWTLRKGNYRNLQMEGKRSKRIKEEEDGGEGKDGGRGSEGMKEGRKRGRSW